MAFTVCHKCGAEREFLADSCPQCQFEPNLPRDLAIAAILTERFEAGEATFGSLPDDLRRIQTQIREGIEFKPAESDVLRHQEAVLDFLSVKPAQLAMAVVKLFVPALLLIAALFGIAASLGYLRHMW